jgi:hypothetical protein
MNSFSEMNEKELLSSFSNQVSTPVRGIKSLPAIRMDGGPAFFLDHSISFLLEILKNGSKALATCLAVKNSSAGRIVLRLTISSWV